MNGRSRCGFRHMALGGLLLGGLLPGQVFLATAAEPASLPPVTASQSLAGEVEAVEPAEPGKRAWTIRPRLVLQETFTDNVDPGAETPRRDQVTEIAPGVRIAGKTARLELSLDYSVREFIYAKDSKAGQTHQDLNARGKLEAIENLLFVDVDGVIRQQAISPFGTQSTSGYSLNDNSTETANFRISPYVQGKLGGSMDYEARYSRSQARAESSAVADTDVAEWRAMLRGDRYTRIGWQLEAARQEYDYNRGRTIGTERLRAQGGYRVGAEWEFLTSIGRERHDFFTENKESSQIYGAGVNWRPGPRTDISFFREKRFFGHGHRISFSHRMPRSALKYSDTKDISALPSQLTTPGSGTLYDLWFAQLAAAIPDPGARADYLAGYFQQNGISLNSPISGFLGSQVSAQRRQELSYVLRGARNSVTLAFHRTQDDRLGVPSLVGGDEFSAASISQRGVSVSFAHQLSGLSTLNLQGSQSRSAAASVADLVATQKSLSAGINTRVGARTNAGVTARRTISETPLRSYDENAVVGTLTVQF